MLTAGPTQFIRSADRARLNVILLNWVSKHPNVKIFFNHGLTKLDLDRKVAKFEIKDPHNTATSSTGKTVTVDADFFVGADGAHSASRRFFQRYVMYAPASELP